MEKSIIIMNFIIFILAFVGHSYGMHNFIVKRKALYLQMVAGAVGCFMFSALFELIFTFVHRQFFEGFHIGMIGVIGGFFFFFTANFGQMDGLVDDKSSAFTKTRIIALIAPIVVVGLYAAFFCLVDNFELRCSVGFVALFIAAAGYYNFKHAIIYDVELGIVGQIRSYNVLACLCGILVMLKYIGQYANIEILYYISCIALAIALLLITPVIKRGAEKWTI